MVKWCDSWLQQGGNDGLKLLSGQEDTMGLNLSACYVRSY